MRASAIKSRCHEMKETKMAAQQATAMQTTKSPAPVRQTEPWTEFERIYNDIAQKAFEIFEGKGRWFGNDLEDWFRAEAQILHPVHLDIRETDSSISVKAEVPGFTAKDLEINVEPRRLKIAGKRQTKEEERKGKAVCSESCSDQILRVVDLPIDVDTSKVDASLKEGVLSIELPKAVHAKTVRVELKTS
jgi:HSP20 family protein